MPKAIGKRVFVVLDPKKKAELPKTQAGIITDIAPVEEVVTTGTVYSIGREVAERGEIKEGDKVYIGEHYGDEKEIGGVKLVVLSQDGIVAVLD